MSGADAWLGDQRGREPPVDADRVPSRRKDNDMRIPLITGALVLATAFAAALPAGAQESGTLFHLGAGSKHTNIAFVSEAEIETIHGTTNQMSGTFFVDFDELTGKCNLTVPVAGLRTGIPTRDEHLRSDQWLDAEAHPNITLTSSEITLTETKPGRVYTAEIKGKLTVHGVEKERTIEATVIRLPEKLGKKMGAGDWVKLSSRFEVNFDDHGITIPNAEKVGPKVSKTWSVSASVFATTEAPKKGKRRR
jgi:polyisoprenoid-binding protein YceI